MKKILIYSIALAMTAGSVTVVNAGNPDRQGEAGAYELLINGWARSSGLFGMNSARIMGVEAMRVNVGGLSFLEKTEVVASYTSWLTGSDVNIVQAGFGQRFKEENVIGISVQSLNFGEITRTTTSLPEGGIGTFSPTFLNIGLAYARTFSNSIHAGMTFRLITEQIEDIGATGFALDAGIQYVTGPRENIRFGVAIRNLGTNMKYAGDGFSFRGDAPDADFQQTLQQRSEKFELPSLLNIGAGYDFYAGPSSASGDGEDDDESYPDHRISVMANFTSNSVGKDYVGGGLEYAFREMFMVRGGYRYEDGITSSDTRTSAHTGFSAGMSIDVPIAKNSNTRLGVDYSFRPTSPFSGTHSAGLRLNL